MALYPVYLVIVAGKMASAYCLCLVLILLGTSNSQLGAEPHNNAHPESMVFVGIAVAAEVSSVPLRNAAVPGLRMPVVGIDTGGYAFSPSQHGYGMTARRDME